MGDFQIRDAVVEDAAAVAAIKYWGWQETYRDIISESYLTSMKVEDIEASWRKILSPQNDKNKTAVLTNDVGIVCGFVSYGNNPHKPAQSEVEIMALYLLKECHKMGLGKQLFVHGVNQLKKQGHKSFCLLVLSQNPAIHFYRRFKPDYERSEQISIGGAAYEEILLGWSDIDKFRL